MPHNKKMPLISVIVPIFKVEKFLSNCIESILEQTYQNIELILVNDGSPDNSGKICELYQAKYSNKIKYIYQENSGCSSARNKGLSVSKGDFISFIDGDDRLPSNYYDAMLINASAIDKHTAFIFCPLRFMKLGKLEYTCSFDKVIFDSTINASEIPSALLNSSCNKLFVRSVINDLGLRFPTDSHFSEDMAFVLKLLGAKNKAVFTSNTYYEYNIHSGGVTSQYDETHLYRFIRESLITYSNVIDFYKENEYDDTIVQLNITKSFLPDFYFKLGLYARENRNFDWRDMVLEFEKGLGLIANTKTLRLGYRLKIYYLFKFFVYRDFNFAIKIYKTIKNKSKSLFFRHFK
ncbi:glycosyltransferase family 2 protein [Aeromonas rivipollensis]|uniref:glycosyltransferase family 2 protein n=1 Tax=Aeromonas rivipollensis TaxID=948519 RepID=UPI00398973D3